MDLKSASELAYWRKRKMAESDLVNHNSYYAAFYTSHFNLTHEFYRNKYVLDIGCGPRGSLEWATMAKERIGLDPLAEEYLKLGASVHEMKYVKGGSENIPFDANYFDVLASFNSLDHVDDLKKTVSEIGRVLKPGGMFLLITDVNHEPTACEPICFSFDVINLFLPDFVLISEKHFEKKAGGIYASILQDISYDHSNEQKRYGILSACFKKNN